MLWIKLTIRRRAFTKENDDSSYVADSGRRTGVGNCSRGQDR